MPSKAEEGPNPTLVSPAAKSPSVAVTGTSVKKSSQFSTFHPTFKGLG